MLINKFNDKVEFLYDTIREKILELKSLDVSDEEKHFIYKNFIDNLMNDEFKSIQFYLTNNVINKKDIEILFKEVLDNLDMVDTKLDELEYYLDKIDEIEKSIIASLLMKIKNLVSKIKFDNIGGYDIVEDFKDVTYVDSNAVSSQHGFLELKSDETIDVSSSSIVEILKSNGLPGDTHTAILREGRIRFNGEEDTKLNLEHITDEDGMFEYEIISIPREEYTKTKGYGFSYDEGISYINNEKKLELKLKITFKRPIKANTIRFKDCQKSIPYVIKAIKIKSERGSLHTVAKNTTSTTFNTYSFKTASIKELQFELEQEEKEDCYIGHYYNSEIKQSEFGYCEEYEQINIGSINNLGVTIDPITKQLKHPKTNNVYNCFDENSIKTNLYNLPYQRELIPCKRASISLGGVTIFSKKYSKEGFCVLEYKRNNPIKSITFEANEYMPNTEYGTYLNYYISFDNETWHQITPMHRTDKDNFHTIMINSLITTVPYNTMSIFTNNKEYKFYIKVEVGSSNGDVSPMVNQLCFKISEWRDE